MCGIIGYIGDKNVLPILIQGLKKLEYRGYDSAGIAVLDKSNKIKIKKCKGRITNLEGLLTKCNIVGRIGLGHTRWATHGCPSDNNAHPHFSSNSEIAVVHNGIIENYLTIKNKLIASGFNFLSETDTEVIPNLIQKNYQGNLTEAVRKSLIQINGSYAIGVISKQEPDKIVVAKKYSPLVIGIGEKEMYIASDIPALLNYTKKVIFLGENEIATISKDRIQIIDCKGKDIKKEIMNIEWDAEMAEKGGYKHFMLKEIFQQPLVIRENLEKYIYKRRINLSCVKFPVNKLYLIEKIHIVACGTASYAALVGKYVIESLTGIPVEVDYASEFRYRTQILNKKTLMIIISQSGETADTIAAMNKCRGKVLSTLAIVNVRGSTISREANQVMHINAGPEIGVASTKAFIGQLISLYLLAVLLGKIKNKITEQDEVEIISEMMKLPQKIEIILQQNDIIKSISHQFLNCKHFLYLGRDINFPIALEGALKLKEISYIHAEAYPAGELKHGPLALIDADMPVITVAPNNTLLEKLKSNMQEVSARGGQLIVFMDETLKAHNDENVQIISIP
ncbi:MAG: glutamine--fructose-6-phosphate transaminase (isomerizing), partial [Atribacterota bacterium]|nr:glutamine--fructose-6-phosphate transaminase (isomerizing) [Atribacterota bacterium]